MAIRTSAPQVCAIIDTALKPDAVVPFIKPASLLVDDIAAADATLASDLLLEIETYLAAHFLTLFEPRAEKEEAGDTKFKYEGKTAMGFDSSKYGQMAIILDPTGTLAALNKKDRVEYFASVRTERDVEGLL